MIDKVSGNQKVSRNNEVDNIVNSDQYTVGI